MSQPETSNSRADIALAAFNARYHHASLGLRYLTAALGDLQDRANIVEAVITDRPADTVERILGSEPLICGLSVHVWSAEATATALGDPQERPPGADRCTGGPGGLLP